MANTKQNRWVNYGIVAIVVAVVIGALAYLNSQFKRINITINKGYTTEAILNPYLAAQKYLEQRSITAKTAIDLTQIWDQLEPGDTLILLNNRVIPEPYQQPLIDWVYSGGHLIITAHKLWDEEYQESGDLFLDQLGVRLYNDFSDEAQAIGKAVSESLTDLTEEKEEAENEDQFTEAHQCDVWGYSHLTFIDYDVNLPPIQVQFGRFAYLYDASGEAQTPEYFEENQMLQYPKGKGMITAVTSHHMWNNQNIGWYDHAYYLWLLVQDTKKVWLVFDRTSDSLLTLILNHLLEPFVAGLLLLALYLWYRGKRFGPIVPEPEKARRSLLEHLVANARFHWRHQQITPLIQRLREDIKTQYIKRHGNLHDQDYVMTALAKSSQLTHEQVRWALTSDIPEKEQEFTQLVRLLQRLRNAV